MTRLRRAIGLRRGGLASAALACAMVAGSCGGGSTSPTDLIQAEVDDLRRAFDAGDVTAVCARMAMTEGCMSQVRHLVEHSRPSGSRSRSGERTVVKVEQSGRRASAIVTLHDQAPGRLRFLERDGDWKLKDVALAPIQARSRWPGVTDNQVESFRVARMRGSRRVPCPPITKIAHAGHAAVRGGCGFRVSSDSTSVLMLTVFGDFEIARCSSSHVLHLASNTTGTIADRIRFEGPGLCRRIRHCSDGETGLRYPWQGSKLRGPFEPPFHMQLDICVNTPLGRARGMYHFRLVRKARSWAATPYDYPIGDSSIQFLGSAKFEPNGLVLRPAEL